MSSDPNVSKCRRSPNPILTFIDWNLCPDDEPLDRAIFFSSGAKPGYKLQLSPCLSSCSTSFPPHYLCNRVKHASSLEWHKASFLHDQASRCVSIKLGLMAPALGWQMRRSKRRSLLRIRGTTIFYIWITGNFYISPNQQHLPHVSWPIL